MAGLARLKAFAAAMAGGCSDLVEASFMGTLKGTESDLNLEN